MGIGKTLFVKSLTLIVVLFMVILLTVVILGATGLSDRIMNAIVDEQVRGIKQQLAAKITDPEQLEKAVEKIRNELIVAYGLDKPWYVRIPNMAARILTLDLGNARNIQTFTGSKAIADLIAERLPNTILLMTTAMIINFTIGLVVGVKVATKPGSLLDRIVSFYAAISYALPTWWLGIVMILVFAFYLRRISPYYFPYGGMYTPGGPEDPFGRFLDLLWHAALPITTLVIALSGSNIYVTRSIVISTAQEDFVTVARAKGLPEGLVLRRYIIRAAAPPILTNIILGLAGSIGGAILTETVFGWPGMGDLYYKAIMSVDERLILALTYIYTLVYVVARFLLEIFYVILDPRVRY